MTELILQLEEKQLEHVQGHLLRLQGQLSGHQGLAQTLRKAGLRSKCPVTFLFMCP